MPRSVRQNHSVYRQRPLGRRRDCIGLPLAVYHIEDAFKQMKDPHFLGWSPMFHWTDSKIQVHAFYCVLAVLLTSLLQRELARKGEPLSINRMLEELGGIRETLIVYPRRPGQRQFPTATCLTHMNPLQQRLFSLLDLHRYAAAPR